MFSIVINSILVLCLIIIAGFISYKKGIINDKGMPVMSGILINLTLPALMVVSMQKPFEPQLFKDSILILVISAIIHFVGLFAGNILCKTLKAPEDERGIWVFSMVFPNVSYMGVPVIESIYGSDAIFYVSMYTMVFNILSFTLGIRIMTKGQQGKSKLDWKAIAFNPPILGTVIGFLLFVSSIALPSTIVKSLTAVGNMTVPLSMLFIGALLAKSNIRTVFSGWKIYVIIFARLIIMPLIVYFAASPFITDKVILGVLVLLSGMPAATVTAIIASIYGQNSISASKMVFLSTLLSIATIPLLALLLQ